MHRRAANVPGPLFRGGGRVRHRLLDFGKPSPFGPRTRPRHPRECHLVKKAGTSSRKRKRSMAIPAVVDTLLRNHNIDYSVLEVVADDTARPSVQTAVLGDDNGRVQVLYPANCLLDLN